MLSGRQIGLRRFLAIGLLLSAYSLAAQAGECKRELPRYVVEIRRGLGCSWPELELTAAKNKASAVSESAVALESEQGGLADAPSHVRQLSELRGSQPNAVHSAGYAQNMEGQQHYVNSTVGPAEAAYLPLTPVQKLDIFLKSTYSPFTFLSAAFDASLAHAEGDLRGYGGGMPGYGKRFGAMLADNEASVFFSKFFFPWIFKQDPRYFRMQEGPVAKRGLYAISRVVVTRTDSGGRAFNASRVLGRLVVKALSNSYYPPERRGVGATLRRTGNSLITDAGMSLAREFWPDIRDKLLGRRLPKRVNDLADKVVTGK